MVKEIKRGFEVVSFNMLFWIGAVYSSGVVAPYIICVAAAPLRGGILTGSILNNATTYLYPMTPDEKLNKIATTLEALKTDMSWLRESWSNQQKNSYRIEERVSELEMDMAKVEGKPAILMAIIATLTAVLAAILGWVSAK